MPIVEISVYSFVSAILFFSIGLVIIRKLRRILFFCKEQYNRFNHIVYAVYLSYFIAAGSFLCIYNII